MAYVLNWYSRFMHKLSHPGCDISKWHQISDFCKKLRIQPYWLAWPFIQRLSCKEKCLLHGLEPLFCPTVNSMFLVVPGIVSSGWLELSMQWKAEWTVSWKWEKMNAGESGGSNPCYGGWGEVLDLLQFQLVTYEECLLGLGGGKGGGER